MSVLLVLLYITLNGLAIEIALHKSCAKNVAGFTGDRIFSNSPGIWHIVYDIL